jgi:hypothetical protein
LLSLCGLDAKQDHKYDEESGAAPKTGPGQGSVVPTIHFGSPLIKIMSSYWCGTQSGHYRCVDKNVKERTGRRKKQLAVLRLRLKTL